jgi:HK97 family phage major capsid protein
MENLNISSKDFEGLLEGLAEKHRIAIDEKVDQKNSKLLDILRVQGAEITAMKERGMAPGKTSQKLVEESEIKSFIDQTFDGQSKTSNKASIKINSGLMFKTGVMDSEGFYGSPATYPEAVTGSTVDSTLYQAKRKRNLILDHIGITSITDPYLFYMEKQVVTGSGEDASGAAGWVTSAGEKPGRSFSVKTEKVEARKVAVFATVADKLLRDVGSFNNWIAEDLRAEVLEAYNDALLNSDGTGLEPLGLKENAVTFTVTNAFANAIDTPNLIDALIAAAAAMQESKEQPGRFLISDDNFFKLHIMKDQQSRYQNANLVYTSSRGQVYVAGVPVFAVDSADVDSNNFILLAADHGFKIKNYNSLILERGLNADDFRNDRTSFRCFQEVLSYIPEHRFNSVMYDSFENVLSAIETTSL